MALRIVRDDCDCEKNMIIAKIPIIIVGTRDNGRHKLG